MTVFVNKAFQYELENTPKVYQRVFSKYRRTYGYSLGYIYNWYLNEQFSIDIASNFNLSKEEFHLLNNIDGVDHSTGEYIISNSIKTTVKEGTAIGLNTPISLKTAIIKDKLFINCGFNVSLDRLLVKNPVESDAAMYPFYNNTLANTEYSESAGRYKETPYTKRFGIGSQIGLTYEFRQFGIMSDFTASRLNENIFFSINLGLKYKISSNKQ